MNKRLKIKLSTILLSNIFIVEAIAQRRYTERYNGPVPDFLEAGQYLIIGLLIGVVGYFCIITSGRGKDDVSSIQSTIGSILLFVALFTILPALLLVERIFLYIFPIVILGIFIYALGESVFSNKDKSKKQSNKTKKNNPIITKENENISFEEERKQQIIKQAMKIINSLYFEFKDEIEELKNLSLSETNKKIIDSNLIIPLIESHEYIFKKYVEGEISENIYVNQKKQLFINILNHN